jgi:nucleoside-diphosphate-sugar epimerase
VRGLALSATSPDAPGEVFNLGHPEPLTLAAIAAHTVAAAGSGSSVTTVPWPADHARIDIGSFHGDFAKAKRMLGWEPHVGFADGIADTVAYYRANPWAVPAAREPGS